MVTAAPHAPSVGLKPARVGVGRIVNTCALETVTPLVVTDTGPEVAPTGTRTVMLVAFEVTTVAGTPLKLTWGEAPKFVPKITTSAVGAPLVGLRLVMVGVPSTVKTELLVAVTPATSTVIGPVVALAGTEVDMLVVVDPETEASVPLNLTTLFPGVALKLVPLMVTFAVTAPLVGVKPVMVGAAVTVKLEALVVVTPVPATSTLIGPVVAPIGTEVEILLVVDALTLASTPLNLTTLLPGVALKFVPEMVTAAVSAPLVGVNPEMPGVGRTVKLDALVTTTPVPFTRTEIGPVVAPTGTDVVMLVLVEPVTVANVPLKRTSLLAGVVLKLVPLITTEAVTDPLVGVKPVIVGFGITVKLEALVTVTPVPLTNTEIGPVVAPSGTVAVMLVDVLAVTLAIAPLKRTSLLAGVVLKFVPTTVIEAPDDPVAGLNPVIVGFGRTVKLEALVTVTAVPLTSTETGPVVAPSGTSVVMLVDVLAVTLARVPLNRT
jgi:hypothetical protein